MHFVGGYRFSKILDSLALIDCSVCQLLCLLALLKHRHKLQNDLVFAVLVRILDFSYGKGLVYDRQRETSLCGVCTISGGCMMLATNVAATMAVVVLPRPI